MGNEVLDAVEETTAKSTPASATRRVMGESPCEGIACRFGSAPSWFHRCPRKRPEPDLPSILGAWIEAPATAIIELVPVKILDGRVPHRESEQKFYRSKAEEK